MIGKIIKGSFKVVGSAGLLLIAGASKITATVLDQNGGEGGMLDEIGDGCMNVIKGMWDVETEYKEESNTDPIHQKQIRLRQGIDRYKRLRQAAERNGNQQTVAECNAKIEELEEQLRSLSE